MEVREGGFELVFEFQGELGFYVRGDFFAKLAMAITDSEEVEGWLSPKNVRCKNEAILILLEGIIWYKSHSGGKCELGDYVFSLPEYSLYHLLCVKLAL